MTQESNSRRPGAAVKKKLLVLEDDPNLGFILQENLELRGYETTLCVNGVDGLHAYRGGSFDLCLVDVMMPKKDGFTFAREVREQDQETPIIFLTAKSMKEDRIEGFQIGGDDYVTKPFSMEELALRIQAVLKRTEAAGGQGSPAGNDQAPFSIGAYSFDHGRRTLEFKGKKQKLTGREADLLRLLCVQENRTLDREYALKALWGNDDYFNGRSMDVFISRLRGYLRKDANVGIVNVHGKGFKLITNAAG
jgi:DNA-binding response OmpR family regulator